ncbi:unnamed protein product, partial [Ascophyllum nodosum]
AKGISVDDAPECWEELDEISLLTPPVVPARETERDTSKRAEGCTRPSRSAAEELGALEGEGMEASTVERLESLPVLLVDLGRVCGFRIAGAEEAEAVGGRVRAALHESFRERSEELFETGSAIHADTGTLAEELCRRSGWAAIDYPLELDGGASVGEAWRKVTTPSGSEAVEAVRVALVGTNRDLIWKRDMLEQLEAVAEREGKARDRREEEQRIAEGLVELEAWRSRRREQLERLIEIRPMFVRRRAVAEEKLLSVGSERRLEGGADPVAEAVVRSLDAKLESIDDLIARLEIEEGQEGYGFVPSDDDAVSNDYDVINGECDVINGEYDVIDGDGDGAQGLAGFVGAADTEKHLLSVVPQRQQKDETAATAATTAVAVTGAAAVVVDKRSKKTNKNKKNKKKGKGIVERLQDRRDSSVPGAVGGVGKRRDGIGESGEGKGDTGGESGGGGGERRADESEGRGIPEAVPPRMSLLDAVAAMILGRYPQGPLASSEEHFRKIAAMHQRMK